MAPEIQPHHDLNDIMTRTVIRELTQIDRKKVALLFTRLVIDRQAADPGRFVDLQGLDHAAAVNRYVQLFINNGFYNACRRRFSAMYSGFDNSALDEIVLLSIWRSFYLFPWGEAGVYEQRVRGYINATVAFLVRTNYQSADGGTIDDIHGDSLFDSVPASNYTAGVVRPVEREIIRQEEIPAMEATFLNLSARKTALEQKRISFFYLLMEGLSVSEAAVKLRVEQTTALYWVQQYRTANPQLGADRIAVRADREWVWNGNTARVILDSGAAQFLNSTQINALLKLKEYGSVKKTIVHLQIAEKTFYSILYEIKVVLQSNGTKTKGREFSRVARRRVLILFLRSVSVNCPEDKAIRQALIDTKGNIAAADRLLGARSGTVGNWLMQKGFYKG